MINNGKCEICDRSDCAAFLSPVDPRSNKVTQEELNAEDDCEEHKVDWRTRALAAESANKIPIPGMTTTSRAETGPLRFKGDWNGLFIRGDNALMRFLPAIRWTLEKLGTSDSPPETIQDLLGRRTLQGLAELLASVEQDFPDVQVTTLKAFGDCVKPE